MEKKKFEVTIAGVDMSIISDEREEIVMRLVAQLDAQIADILKGSRNCSKLDAAILVALDHSCNRVKSEKRVRNLEAQIALYDANLRRMREENIKLKNSMLGKVSETAAEIIAEEQLPIEEVADDDEGAPVREDAPDSAVAPEEVAAPEEAPETEEGAKADKLRQIENLLRRN